MSKAKAEKGSRNAEYVTHGRQCLASWFISRVRIALLPHSLVYYESKGTSLRFYYADGAYVRTLCPSNVFEPTVEEHAAWAKDWGWSRGAFLPSKGDEVLNGSREHAYRTLTRLAELAGLPGYVRVHFRLVAFETL